MRTNEISVCIIARDCVACEDKTLIADITEMTLHRHAGNSVNWNSALIKLSRNENF
jgi:hypothetical protein